MPSRDVAILAIVAAAVCHGDRPSGEHDSGVSEIQAAFFKRQSPFRRVETDVDRIIVSR
jgi:hypothetical protein